MRAQDRMAVCELQEAETATLKALFAHDSRVDVRAGDGYALLRCCCRSSTAARSVVAWC